jgi:hypothetical protein
LFGIVIGHWLILLAQPKTPERWLRLCRASDGNESFCFSEKLHRSVIDVQQINGLLAVMFDKSVYEFESRRRLKSPFDKGGFRGILLCRRLEIPPTPFFQRGGIAENGQRNSQRILETPH